MTPEGKVKEAVKKVLRKHGAYYYMPVSAGYGSAGLDFHCHANGHAILIETKAAGKRPTPRQQATIRAAEKSGAAVLIIDGTDKTDTIEDLEEWLCKALLTKSVPRSKRS